MPIPLRCRDVNDMIHPLRYAAAALLDDGSTEVAWQKKGIEFGTTLDAVTQVQMPRWPRSPPVLTNLTPLTRSHLCFPSSPRLWRAGVDVSGWSCR
jgi:hypothetical protein